MPTARTATIAPYICTGGKLVYTCCRKLLAWPDANCSLEMGPAIAKWLTSLREQIWETVLLLPFPQSWWDEQPTTQHPQQTSSSAFGVATQLQASNFNKMHFYVILQTVYDLWTRLSAYYSSMKMSHGKVMTGISWCINTAGNKGLV